MFHDGKPPVNMGFTVQVFYVNLQLLKILDNAKDIRIFRDSCLLLFKCMSLFMFMQRKASMKVKRSSTSLSERFQR
jgi:hypothetical protein